MGYKTGADRAQMTLFPESLDEYIDGENPVRVIDVYVERLNFKELELTKANPADAGCPPYSPKDMLKH
jgi:transposase